MERLFNKYLSLVKQTFGEEAAERIRTSVNNAILEEQSKRRTVWLDKRSGKCTVGKGSDHLFDDDFMEVSHRVSEVFVFMNKDRRDGCRLRCKVDGVQQMSVNLGKERSAVWVDALGQSSEERALVKMLLAGEVYADTLSRPVAVEEQNKGIKR